MLYAAKVFVVLLGLCFSIFYAGNAVDIFVDTKLPIIEEKRSLGLGGSTSGG